MRRAGGLGRPLRRRLGRHPHLRGVHQARLPDGQACGRCRSTRATRSTPRATSTRPTRRCRQAMGDAIDVPARREGVPFDAPWGSLQVAGDRGAPPIPLGGGLGDSAGNANALASSRPEAEHRTASGRSPTAPRTSRRSRSSTTAGSTARTILTYGQSENPRSRWSLDQTRLFSKERWVRFPFTDGADPQAAVSSDGDQRLLAPPRRAPFQCVGSRSTVEGPTGRWACRAARAGNRRNGGGGP